MYSNPFLIEARIQLRHALVVAFGCVCKCLQSLETSGSKQNEMKKFVAVWENRFLEKVQLCSERIPGELKRKASK